MCSGSFGNITNGLGNEIGKDEILIYRAEKFLGILPAIDNRLKVRYITVGGGLVCFIVSKQMVKSSSNSYLNLKL